MDYVYLSLLLIALLIFLAHYPLFVLPVVALFLFLYTKRARILKFWESQKKKKEPVPAWLPRVESWQEELELSERRIAAALEEARLLEELRNDSMSRDDSLDNQEEPELEYEDGDETGTEEVLRRRRIPPPVPPKPERSISQEEFDERNRSRLPPYLMVRGENDKNQRLERINITNQVNAIAGHFANIDPRQAPPKTNPYETTVTY